jgi:hypothetical protein
MEKLYPIVRRVRRPLLPSEAIPPEVAAQSAKDAEAAAPATEAKPETPEANADVAEQ